MEYDQDKVDKTILALLYLTSSHDQYATRAWMGLDLAVLDRLHAKGFIGDPAGKGPTSDLTEKAQLYPKSCF